MSRKPVTLWKLGWLLIAHHFGGWKIKPGYTVVEREAGGGIYIAVWMERPDG